MQGILINGQFPGPTIDAVTNDNIIVDVINKLDEPFLITWLAFLLAVLIVLKFRNCVNPPHRLYFLTFVGNQEWNQTEKDHLARWSTRNQLPDSSKHKLEIQVSNEGSDWNLHLLSFNETA